MKTINLMMKLPVVLIFFLILACSTASADFINITSPPSDANFQLDSNQNPPTVTFNAMFISDCSGYASDVFRWKGILNYNYLAENGTIQTNKVIFSEDTDRDNSGWYTNTTWTPNLQGIKMIGGSMYVVVNTTHGELIYTDNRSITFGSNSYKLEVKPNTKWVILSAGPFEVKDNIPNNIVDGGSDVFDSATIDILVKDPEGNPASKMNVSIRAITVPGSGGHIHDNKRAPDSQGTRPTANLIGIDNTKVTKMVDYSHQIPPLYGCNDVTAITDSSGMVHIRYTPPIIVIGQYKLQRVVAGVDKIKVSLVEHPEITEEIQIGVGYQGFVPFSDKNVYLKPQNEHRNEFWCTQDTANLISEIAKNFKEKTGRPLPITAMSLQYGGLSDISGNWLSPHITHSHGKNVDIGFNKAKSGEGDGGESMLGQQDLGPLLKSIQEVNRKVPNIISTNIEKTDKNEKSPVYCVHLSFRK